MAIICPNFRQCSDIYILFATDIARIGTPELWRESSCVFFEIIEEEKRERSGRAVTFGYVDNENMVRKEGHAETEIVIRRYQNGTLECQDVVEDRAILASLNRAQSSQKMQQGVPRPVKRAFVELVCRGSSCDDSVRMWSCEHCQDNLQYGFDDHFYCSCGRAPVNTFSYKCNGATHGDDFIKFNSQTVKKETDSLQPTRYLNILLLGETGVGKSTWINGFANYLSFKSLDDARNSDTVCLIP